MNDTNLKRIQIVDSHTGGEPTRVVIGGGPKLMGATLAERLRDFRSHHDAFRSAIVNEPRGSDVMVGALLVEPSDPTCTVGVIFFNNVGYLGMCGHGTIGLIVTLGYLGRITPGAHRIETPVGVVAIEYHESGEVSVRNVPCFRHARQVAVDVPGYGTIVGDIAWGGNWFFLVDAPELELSLNNREHLVTRTWAIRQALENQGITGSDGAEIDHIELFGPSARSGVQSRNFVLCPGKAYDRSPCGTGTSAKLACLYEDGKLHEGEIWKQESIVGSVFAGSVAVREGKIIPYIQGSAYVTGEATLLLNPADPFCWGIE